MSQFNFTNVLVTDKEAVKGSKRVSAFLGSLLKSDTYLTDVSEAYFKNREISAADRVLVTNASSKVVEIVDSKGQITAIVEPSGSFIIAGRDRIEDLGLLCHHTTAVSAV